MRSSRAVAKKATPATAMVAKSIAACNEGVLRPTGPPTFARGQTSAERGAGEDELFARMAPAAVSMRRWRGASNIDARKLIVATTRC